MKKVMKVFMVVALTLSATTIFAQKLGRINMQEIIVSMPETTEMQTKLEAFRQDLVGNLETMQVELNNKFVDYQNTATTATDSVRSLKEKDIQDLQTRMEQFEQSAMQEMQAKQNELLQPIISKAQEAVKKVSQAGAYTVVYDLSVASLAYYDEASVTDLTSAVKAELGVVAQ
ncbi:MAG: OmpH family outer membrane protein [Rikenellaceae bacterium]